MDDSQVTQDTQDTQEVSALPSHVQAMQDAGAPESQVENARQLALNAPDEPGAGKPYEYPPVTYQEGDPNDPKNVAQAQGL